MKKPIVFACLLLAAAAHAQPLHLITEDYPPFGYREAGVYKGSSIEQIRLLMKDAGLDYSINIMPWARALAMAETQEMTCVFTTVHNEERDKRFKWVEPLLTDRSVLVRKAGSGVNPATVAEATQYVVGTQRGDFTADILEARHFSKIDLTSDFNLTLRKLLHGRIDLMPISERYFEKLKREGVGIEKILPLSEQVYSIACHRSVPDRDINKMQTALTKLIDNGTQAALFRKYGLEGQGN